jgi:hypothetical protein
MDGGYRVKGSFVYPEVDDVRANGKVAETVPASPYRYSVDLAWDDKIQTWQVLDFIYGKRKA